MNITDKDAAQWLLNARNKSGIPRLVLSMSTEFPTEPFTARIQDCALYFGFGATAQAAIDRIKAQLPEARERAKQLREEAKRKAAEADMIEQAASVTPLEVIADKEGRAA